MQELPLLTPPATNTSPFGRSVAVWLERAVVMLPLITHWPVAGLYSSALGKIVVLPPPATSTWPFSSSGGEYSCHDQRANSSKVVLLYPNRGTLPLPFDIEVESSDAVGRGRFHVHNIATICAARRTGTVTELLLLPTVAAPEFSSRGWKL